MLLCTISLASAQSIDSLTQTVELINGRAVMEINIISENITSLPIKLPPRINDLHVFMDETEIFCETSEHEGFVQVVCPTDTKSHFVTLNFNTKYPVFQLPKETFYQSTFIPVLNISDFNYILKLPQGFVLKKDAVASPEPKSIYSDGQRIILRWQKNDLQEPFKVNVSMNSTGVPWLNVIIGVAVGGVLIFIFVVVIIFKKKRDSQKITELEQQVRTDGLTKVLNRFSFNNDLPKIFSSVGQLTLLMVDIDHFKKINDTHGHQKGDEILQNVAKSLNKYTRKSDVVYRYGGEEFAILLSNTNPDKAKKIIENLRKKVSKKTGVTVSIGVAHRTETVEDPAHLIKQADIALYKAKENGRNRAEFF